MEGVSREKGRHESGKSGVSQEKGGMSREKGRRESGKRKARVGKMRRRESGKIEGVSWEPRTREKERRSGS